MTAPPDSGDPPGAGPWTAALLGSLLGFTGMGSAAVAVAVPRMVVDLDVPASRGVWVIAGYALCVAVGTVLYGRLADRNGIRGPLTLGLGLVGLGGVVAAAAPDFGVLVAGRMLQGLGAAAAPALTLAAVRAVFPWRERIRATSVLAATSLVVTAMGPVLGGILTETAGWRPALLLPATGLLALPFLWRVLPVAVSGVGVDYVGAVLVMCLAGSVVLAVQAPALGRTALVAGAGLALPALALLPVWVRRHPAGFLPHAVLSHPLVMRVAVGAAGAMTSFLGLLVVVPGALAEAGWSPSATGLVMLPGALAGTVVSSRITWIVDRIGAVRCSRVSGALAVGSVGLCAAAVAGVPALHVAALAASYGAFALGQPALGALVGDAVPETTVGVALGIASLVAFVMGSVGAALAGLHDVLGWPAALGLLAVLPLASVAVAPHGRR